MKKKKTKNHTILECCKNPLEDMMKSKKKRRNLLYYTIVNPVIVEIMDEKQNPIESMCCYFGLGKTNKKKKERNIHYNIPQCQNFLDFHSFSLCYRCLLRPMR